MNREREKLKSLAIIRVLTLLHSNLVYRRTTLIQIALMHPPLVSPWITWIQLLVSLVMRIRLQVDGRNSD